MSDENTKYEVRSSEHLAQVEPEADYYRRQMRRIGHALDQLPMVMTIDSIDKAMSTIRAVTKESLKRQRSNGQKFDGMERELAELRAVKIDYQVLQIQHREIQEKLKKLWRDMGPVEGFVRATVGEAAIRIDRWLKVRRRTRVATDIRIASR